MREYKMRIAVDFGSTVSALAWNLLERKTPKAGYSLVEGNGWEKSFPTVIVEKSQNPGQSFENNLYGEDALDVLKKQPGVKAATEFKHGLYDPNSPDFRESCRLTVLFLGYLRQFLESNHNLSGEIFSTAEKEVCYTTPLISAYNANLIMQEMLLQAGFTPENGYARLKKMDEVTSLSSLALSSKNSLFKEEMKKLEQDENGLALALIIDIGGLTADINLVLFRYDVGPAGYWDYQCQQLSCWPEPSSHEKTADSLCGGLALDQALCRYLMTNGFIHPQMVQEALEQRGYMDFREFKEQSNDYYWRLGRARDTLDGLEMVDYARGLIPEANFEATPTKCLTPERFMTEVAADYIRALTQAIRSVIREGAAHEAAQGLDIREETIDWVFLTGGGSNIFFLRPMLCGQLPQGLPELNLKKIKSSPERILPDENDSSLLDHTMNCVNGVLCYSGNLVASSPADYQIQMRFVSSDGTNSTVIHEQTVPLVTKRDILPVERSGAFDFTYHYTSSLRDIRCELLLLQSGEENISAVGAAVDPSSASKTSDAETKDSLARAGRGAVNTAKRLLPAVGYIVAAGALVFLQQQEGAKDFARAARNAFFVNRHEFESEIHSIQDNMGEFANRITSDGDDTMHVTYLFRVDEERHIICQLTAESKSFTKDAVPTHLDFV